MRILKKQLLIYFVYLLYWIMLFIFLKVIFLVYNAGLTADLNFSTIAGIFTHGFSMDLSASFYMMILPTLFLITLPYFSWNLLRKVINIYTIILLAIISFLMATDLELYRYWEFRLDKTPLKYFNDSPEVMLASVHTGEVIMHILLAVALFTGLWFAFKKLIIRLFPTGKKPGWLPIPVFLTMLVLSIIPIRGGLGVATMNSGFAYFSDITYANHAALNMPFHAFESLANNHPEKNPYASLPEETVTSYCSDLTSQEGSPVNSVLKTSRPNIVLIILESFTAKAIEPVGGLPGVTPNLNELVHDGLLFSNFYSSGDRTDKALPAILSSFTSIPDQSVSKFSAKAEKLPMLPAQLKEAGWNTSFWYGGTADFAGLQAYLIHGRFDYFNDITNFNPADRTFKWGVHDAIVFDSLFADIQRSEPPFFKVILSQSSHEPFDVPMEPRFHGTDMETRFKNSLFYTDSVVGDFVRRAHSEPWWDSTLVIIVADHGTKLPGRTANESWEKFHIPMIWLGGALAVRDTVVSKTASQTDIYPTLMAQLSLELPGSIPVGKDIFSDNSPSMAYYAYNNGFGLVTDSVKYIIDNVTDEVIRAEGEPDDSLLLKGRAIRQLTYGYFINL